MRYEVLVSKNKNVFVFTTYASLVFLNLNWSELVLPGLYMSVLKHFRDGCQLSSATPLVCSPSIFSHGTQKRSMEVDLRQTNMAATFSEKKLQICYRVTEVLN